MKIKSLQLKNFKRFTDLTLQNIPENARLVLLIGANGSGKSSVFDAFELISDRLRAYTIYNHGMKRMDFSDSKGYSYYHKQNAFADIQVDFFGDTSICCHFTSFNDGFIELDRVLPSNLFNARSAIKYGPSSVSDNLIVVDRILPSDLFYGRSAVRYVAKITRTSIGQAIDITTDPDRPKYYIDTDQRFENDIDLLIKEVVEKVFQGINTDSTKQLDEIRAFLQQINDAFPRIFGTENGTMLSFKSFLPPADGKPSRLIFRKGVSELDYGLLSAGEKEVVNLLFNLFVRRKAYTNTIYFLDEIDTHLNTKLQYNLLKEITENWIPANCQLWTASHSLGFIQYAKDFEQGITFDFDDYDFDSPKILSPLPKDNAEVYEIAVSKEFLPRLFKDYRLYFVENRDQIYYAELNFPSILFIRENEKNGVYHKARNGAFGGIVDRDFLTDDDIFEIEKQYTALKILRLYSIENYLYHPENLEEFYHSINRPYDKDVYVNSLIAEKNAVLDVIKRKLALVRTGFPFFKEPEHNKKPNQNRFKNESENYSQVAELEDYLNSDSLEDFYKILPMKDYATQLPERQNIPKTALAKTSWFAKQIQDVLT